MGGFNSKKKPEPKVRTTTDDKMPPENSLPLRPGNQKIAILNIFYMFKLVILR
jgi:hypothetical protein